MNKNKFTKSKTNKCDIYTIYNTYEENSEIKLYIIMVNELIKNSVFVIKMYDTGLDEISYINTINILIKVVVLITEMYESETFSIMCTLIEYTFTEFFNLDFMKSINELLKKIKKSYPYFYNYLSKNIKLINKILYTINSNNKKNYEYKLMHKTYNLSSMLTDQSNQLIMQQYEKKNNNESMIIK